MYKTSYHNTLNLEDTKKKESKCKTQEDWVLEVFKSTGVGFTAKEMWELIVDHKIKELTDMELIDALKRACDIRTSVRRSITNLANKGFLVKENYTRDGNSVYRLK